MNYKRTTMVGLIMLLTLTGCQDVNAQYEKAYAAVTKLQTLISNPESLHIRHAYVGTPPLEDYDELILLLFSSLDQENVRISSYFAYENELKYYEGLAATQLYDYRNYYNELSPDKINEHFGFSR